MSFNLPGMYLYYLSRDNLAPEEYERIISPHAAWARICREYEFDDSHNTSRYLINMREREQRSSPDQPRPGGIREKEKLEKLVFSGDVVMLSDLYGPARLFYINGEGQLMSADPHAFRFEGAAKIIKAFDDSVKCRNYQLTGGKPRPTKIQRLSRGYESPAEQYAQAAKKRPTPSSYLTGDKPDLGFVPDYPVLRNTHNLPDEALRAMLAKNNQDVMLLTLGECFEIVTSWGSWKRGWVSFSESKIGQIAIDYGVNYGVNGKDVVTTSMIISQLGSFGIRATTYINHKGTELIKISGHPGIRKILNAPVFAAKNPKVVDLGIGKYGLTKSIVKGARLTFYVAAAYRTIDFILNDATSLAEYLGPLATDVVKIGVASAISWGVGTIALGVVSTVAVPLVVVVIVGLVSAIGLNYLDDKFGVTDKVVKCIEGAQQEFVEKAREMEKGLLDLGAMYADRMLDKGKEVIEYEVRNYIKEVLSNFNTRWF
ncbi:hypothetical protein [Yersinia pseudotuberculosis]|nr:hypothetical protein [Yersinia pseudotuberculosis]CNE41904.1 HNH endonuclease domain-containing protein [Yersinia pseudotuberculosis]